MIAAGNL